MVLAVVVCYSTDDALPQLTVYTHSVYVLSSTCTNLVSLCVINGDAQIDKVTCCA